MVSRSTLKAESTDRGWRRLFFAMWTGQAFSLLGSSLVGFALVWWLADTTDSATIVAVAGIVNMLPTILPGPIAGALVDRWNRRWIMVVSDGAIAFFTALLAVSFWLGEVRVRHVLTILFLRSLGDAFQNPAVRASASLMVPADQLTRVAGMNAALEGSIGFLSPPMGALLLAALHVQGTLAIDVLTALLAIAPPLVLSIPQPRRKMIAERNPSIVREMAEGLHLPVHSGWRWAPGLPLAWHCPLPQGRCTPFIRLSSHPRCRGDSLPSTEASSAWHLHSAWRSAGRWQTFSACARCSSPEGPPPWSLHLSGRAPRSSGPWIARQVKKPGVLSGSGKRAACRAAASIAWERAHPPGKVDKEEL